MKWMATYHIAYNVMGKWRISERIQRGRRRRYL
jgi:hypothetical protein